MYSMEQGAKEEEGIILCTLSFTNGVILEPLSSRQLKSFAFYILSCIWQYVYFCAKILNHNKKSFWPTKRFNWETKFFENLYCFGKEIRWGIESLVAHTKEGKENNNNTTIHLKHNINILSAVREGVKTKS